MFPDASIALGAFPPFGESVALVGQTTANTIPIPNRMLSPLRCVGISLISGAGNVEWSR